MLAAGGSTAMYFQRPADMVRSHMLQMLAEGDWHCLLKDVVCAWDEKRCIS